MFAHFAQICALSLILLPALAGPETQSKKPENTAAAKDTCSIAGLVVKSG